MGDVRLVAVLLLTMLVAGCADDAKPATLVVEPVPAASSEPVVRPRPPGARRDRR